MSTRLNLFKEIIPAVDLGMKDLWDAATEEGRKEIKGDFWTLNRYISNVKTSNSELHEHFLLTVNEYFNKNWKDLQKHPKLLWQLLCLCSHESRKIFYHEWIGFKQKKSSNKIIKFLSEIYPHRKMDELELLSAISTEKECKELARLYGYDDKQIEKLFK